MSNFQKVVHIVSQEDITDRICETRLLESLKCRFWKNVHVSKKSVSLEKGTSFYVTVSNYISEDKNLDVDNELKQAMQDEFPEASISLEHSGGCLLPL